MIERQILARLLYDEDFLRKTLPFLKPDYFNSRIDKAVYGLIDNFVKTYNKPPSKAALVVESDSTSGYNQDEYEEIVACIADLKEDNTDQQWLLDQTERFCQDRAIYNAIMSSIQILDGRDTKKIGRAHV